MKDASSEVSIFELSLDYQNFLTLDRVASILNFSFQNYLTEKSRSSTSRVMILNSALEIDHGLKVSFLIQKLFSSPRP